MKKYKLILLVLSLVIIVLNVLNIDFDDLSFSTNKSPYLLIIVMFLNALSMIISINKEQKENK